MGINKPIIFMFSGQGSQYYHMGRELYERNVCFRGWMDSLDEMAQDIMGESVLQRVYDDGKSKRDCFNHTLFSHPAIFIIEYSLAQHVIETHNIHPSCVLGASMGEFASLAVAGVLSLEEALQTVIRQAETIEEKCLKSGMMTILGDHQMFYEWEIFQGECEMASLNYNEHFVVSGKTERLEEIEQHLEARGIICAYLPVSYAFHSGLLDPAARKFVEYIAGINYHPPSIPVISCSTAGAVLDIRHDHLWEAVRRRVRFSDTINELEKDDNCVYLDLGPSGTLASFIKNILGRSASPRYFSYLKIADSGLDQMANK